jgi:hypothetical protein
MFVVFLEFLPRFGSGISVCVVAVQVAKTLMVVKADGQL